MGAHAQFARPGREILNLPRVPVKPVSKLILRRGTGRNVLAEAIDRLEVLYAEGHALVVSFSAGKDSTVCLNVALEAARRTNRLPVKVVMRDEEIMFPGTYEYAERVANRGDIDFHWIYANQPIINCFNRASPYWWVFDPLLPASSWMRSPPARAYRIDEKNIIAMTIPERFPVAEGKTLFAVIGLRAQESNARRYSIHSAGGYLTKPNDYGVRNCRPIYDWTDGDVWKAIKEGGWDYNTAYDTMFRMGVPRRNLRIAPPTMNPAGIPHLAMAQAAWPQWFDRMAIRCPGVRAAAQYGMRAVTPDRRSTETWEQCFHRVNVDTAPTWIAARATEAKRRVLSAHTHHATSPLPEVKPCRSCQGSIGSWRNLTLFMYGGDPFSVKSGLPYVEPEFFRVGSGTWGGKPSF